MDRPKQRQRYGRRLALTSAGALCLLCACVAVAIAAGRDRVDSAVVRITKTEGIGFHYGETGFSALAARPDGGLVAGRDRQIESFLPNGTPDPASPPRQLPSFSQLFLLADGRMLVQAESKLTLQNADGSVDTGFGDQGSIASVGYASAAAELPSGRILVAGLGQAGTHTQYYFAEYELINPDGTVVGGGPQQVSLPGGGEEVAEIVATPDGGALIVGDDVLVEVRADGTPNPAFGAGGVVTHPNLELTGAHFLPDGSIALVGTGPGAADQDLLYARLTPTGRPDLGFGTEGAHLFDLGGRETIHAASWGTDGSVIVGGTSLPPGGCFRVEGCEEVPILAAFDPEGNLERSFGTDGSVRLEALRGSSDEIDGHGVEHLVRRPDGSLVASGTAPPGESTAFLVAFSPQGGLLSGFGEGGIVRERSPSPAEQTVAGVLPDGRGGTLAVATSTLGIDRTPVLIHYAADGSLDRSLGAGAGFVPIGESHFLEGFASDGFGHLLTTLYDYPHSRLIEFRGDDGAPQASFGAAGVVTLPGRIFVKAVAFAGDSPVVIGVRDVSGDAEPGVVLRYRADGRPDTRFGAGGRVGLTAPGKREVRARAVASIGDGRILVAGFSDTNLVLTRLLADGRPDPTFGTGGWTLAGLAGTPLASSGGVVKALSLGRDRSHLYLAAVIRQGSGARLVLARFDRDGRLDHTFGRQGRRSIEIPEAAAPQAVFAGPRGVLVVLNRGRRPLVTFGSGGARLEGVGGGRKVTNLRAARSGDRLVLGWNAASGSGGDTYYLGELPLGGR